jgi:hypothetical protein
MQHILKFLYVTANARLACDDHIRRHTQNHLLRIPGPRQQRLEPVRVLLGTTCREAFDMPKLAQSSSGRARALAFWRNQHAVMFSHSRVVIDSL